MDHPWPTQVDFEELPRPLEAAQRVLRKREPRVLDLSRRLSGRGRRVRFLDVWLLIVLFYLLGMAVAVSVVVARLHARRGLGKRETRALDLVQLLLEASD